MTTKADEEKPQGGFLGRLQALGNLQEDSDVMTFSNGVKLRRKAISGLLIADATKDIRDRQPMPPMWQPPGGKPQEPNYASPKYRTAIMAWTAEIVTRLTDLLALMALEVLEVPSNIPKWDSEEYAEELRQLHLLVPDNKQARFAAWVKYRVIVSNEDQSKFSADLLRMFGATEKDVHDMMEFFRRNRTRRKGASSAGVGAA